MDTRQVDQALAALGTRTTEWARLPIQGKISYLKQIRQLALTHAQRWSDAETKAKLLAPGSPLIGVEAWIAGPFGLISWLTASIQTLTMLDEGGDLLAHVKTRRGADGTLIARVLPAGTCERLLFHGVTAEVWMQDGVTEQNLRQNMAGYDFGGDVNRATERAGGHP